MIVCKVCGNKNNDQEEFCASCGRYLAWSGEHVDVAPEAEPELFVEDAYVPERPGPFRRLAISLGLARDPARPTPTGAGSGSTPARGAGVPASGGGAARAAGTATAGTVGVAAGATAGATVGVVAAGSSGAPGAASPGDEGAAELVNASARAVSAGGAAATAQVLVVPEVVGADDEPTTPVALVGGAGPQLRPRRPGESLPTLPVLPPLPSREPASSERVTPLRRPTEVPAQSRPKRSRTARAPGLPETATTPSPGDVFCPRCGQFNNPSRVYCRRCGLELQGIIGAEPIDYEPLTWWQRHLHHDVHVVGAGDRPGRWGKIVTGGGSQGRAMRIAGRAGAICIGALVIFSFFGPYARTLKPWFVHTWHAVYNQLNAKEVAIHAQAASATSSAPGHPAFSAVDGANNTYWQSAVVVPPKAKKPTAKKGSGAAGSSTGHAAVTATTAPATPRGATARGATASGATAGGSSSAAAGAKAKHTKPATRVKPAPVLPPGVGQVLTIQFSPAVSLNRIAFLNGAAGDLATFDSIGRPQKVEIDLPGGKKVTELLIDEQTLQTFNISAHGVSQLKIKILSTYPGTSVKAVAIDEVEFFNRQ